LTIGIITENIKENNNPAKINEYKDISASTINPGTITLATYKPIELARTDIKSFII
jgi:hypothetical protein